MKKNMGGFDRIFRVIVAIVAVVVYAMGWVSGVWGIVLLVAAGIFVLTSLLSFCPLYVPLGLNTKEKSQA